MTFSQFNFMPYIFIWSDFVYREMNETNITRLSQDVIEKYFATKLRANPKPKVPARHIIVSLKHALVDCAKSQSINEMVNKNFRNRTKFDNGVRRLEEKS
jgi:hypothetical protein